MPAAGRGGCGGLALLSFESAHDEREPLALLAGFAVGVEAVDKDTPTLLLDVERVRAVVDRAAGHPVAGAGRVGPDDGRFEAIREPVEVVAGHADTAAGANSCW